MEKINYTEYRINSDTEESEFFLIERTVEDGVFTEGVKLSSPYKEEIEKIVTLYEQHFKMLELLKGDLYFIKIELKERLKFSDINTDDKTKAMSDRIKELEQTIKECEL